MSDSTVRVIFLGDAASAIRSVNALEGRMGSLGGTAARTGKIIAGAIGISLVGGLAKATTLAIGFDRSMRNVNSIAKVNEASFQRLEKRVLALSKATGQGPKVLADGLYDIVSSGFKANDAIKILAVSAKAATAGMTDTATASKAVVAVLNAYHLGADKARQVSDVLFQTVNKGVLTFAELSQQIGDVLPYASKLNVPLTDIGGALATITLHGVNAAEAATQLKQVMASIIAPSKGLNKELHDMGFESGQAALKALGFQGVIRKLSDASKGNAATLHDWFPNIRALSGFFGISGKNAKQLADNIRSMAGASKGAGATAKAFAEQGKSIAVQWDKATGALAAAGVKIGTTLFPVLATGITHLADFAGWLDKIASKPTIHAKVDLALDTARSAAASLKKMVDDALFPRRSGAVGPVHAEGQITGGDLKFSPGLVSQVQQGFARMNWRPIGIAIGAAIGANLVIGASALDNFSKSLVAWANGPGGHQAGQVGAIIALQIVSSLLDPGFWAQHWQLMLGIAIAVLPVGKLATIGEKFAVFGFKLFGATAGRVVVEGLARLPGLMGTRAGLALIAVGDAIEKFAPMILGKGLSLADGLVRALAKPFGKLAPLMRALLNTAIIAELENVAGQAYHWGLTIAERIASGIINGLSGLPGRIASAIGIGGGGGANATGNTGRFKVPHAKSAAGNFIDRPMLSLVGEDAPRWPEWVIPSNPKYRGRALGLMAQAQGALGLPGFAKGGGPSKTSHRYTGHQLRGRTPVQAAVGAAQGAINALTNAQARVADLGRTYDQDQRAQGSVNLPPLTLDVPDDPSDTTNTNTHQVVNPEGVAAATAQLNQLVTEKNGILSALETERQRIEDAIDAVQKAINDLMAAIKVLNDKAKAEGANARREHAAANASSASVNRKGGLQDQVAKERAQKKPSKAKITQLENAIRQAGRDHDDHEGAAKTAETNQGRYQKQAGDDADKVKDLRGTLSGLMQNRHDLPYDVRDQQIDIAYLNQQIGQVQGTVGTAAGAIGSGSSGGATSTPDDSILQAMLQQLRDALGLQTAQANVLGGFPSFAGGSIYIPNDMVAQLHAGESVRTADQTISDSRSGGGAGSGLEVHLYGVTSVEDQVEAWVVQNGQKIAAQVVGPIGRSADRFRRSGRARNG